MHMLVFTMLIVAVSGSASTAPNGPASGEEQEQKGKPSEPFRY